MIDDAVAQDDEISTPVMFKKNLNAIHFAEILEEALIPFIRSKFPNHHKFQQDNDPKHCSNYIKTFLDNHNIVWWKTLAKSPYLNPIEKVWGSIKIIYKMYILGK